MTMKKQGIGVVPRFEEYFQRAHIFGMSVLTSSHTGEWVVVT